MAGVTDQAVRDTDAGSGHTRTAGAQLAALTTATLLGALLAGGARIGAGQLLVAVAATQAVVGVSWVLASSAPGRKGALVIIAFAAAGADVTASIWPHSRLGTMLVVFGLAIPVMFVHQLIRGAARVRVVESLGAITLGVIAVVSLAALLQLRHEFSTPAIGGKVVSGVVIAAAAALVVGVLVDLVTPAPRFDPSVDRGLLAVVASAGLGGSAGHLLLGTDLGFLNERGVFVGAAVGALVALFAVATGFVQASAPPVETRASGAVRPVVAVALPLSLVAPVAFLLCLAVRA
jgi:hypothetical protein